MSRFAVLDEEEEEFTDIFNKSAIDKKEVLPTTGRASPDDDNAKTEWKPVKKAATEKKPKSKPKPANQCHIEGCTNTAEKSKRGYWYFCSQHFEQLTGSCQECGAVTYLKHALPPTTHSLCESCRSAKSDK